MRHCKTVILIASLFASSADAGQPAITISYNQTLDSVCSFFRGVAIHDDWKAELTSRQAEFEGLWKVSGPKMIEATEEITGKPFPAKQFTARLTLCNIPSQSGFGISINMRYALKSFTPAPVTMRYKVETLFHELLHKFLAEYPVKNSVLLKQYANEPENTRDHLHLLALEKAVLLKLNENAVLKETIIVDSQLTGGYYKRAWEIVNTTDTEYLKYVAEISQ